MGKMSGSESGMNNPNHISHISESLETIFLGLKYFNSLMQILDPGSEMEKIRIREGKNSDPG
jgi:hypothetical protein